MGANELCAALSPEMGRGAEIEFDSNAAEPADADAAEEDLEAKEVVAAAASVRSTTALAASVL